MARNRKTQDHVRLDNSQAKLKNDKLDEELWRKLHGIEYKQNMTRITNDVKLVSAKQKATFMNGIRTSVVHNDDYKTSTRKLKLSSNKNIVESVEEDQNATSAETNRNNASAEAIIKSYFYDTPEFTYGNNDSVEVKDNVAVGVGDSGFKRLSVDISTNGRQESQGRFQRTAINSLNVIKAVNVMSPQGRYNENGEPERNYLEQSENASRPTQKVVLDDGSGDKKSKGKSKLFDLSEEDDDLLKSLIKHSKINQPKLKINVRVPSTETEVPENIPHKPVSEEQNSKEIQNLKEIPISEQQDGFRRRLIQKPGVIAGQSRMLKLGQTRPATAPPSSYMYKETIWSKEAKKRIQERKRRELSIARDLVMRKSAPARLLVYFDATTMNKMFELQEVDGNRINYMRNHLVFDPDDVDNIDSMEYMYIKSGGNISSVTRRAQSAPVYRKNKKKRQAISDSSKLYDGMSRHKLKVLNDSRSRDVEMSGKGEECMLKRLNGQQLELKRIQRKINNFMVDVDHFKSK